MDGELMGQEIARYKDRLSELKHEAQELTMRLDQLARPEGDSATEEELIATVMAGNGTTTMLDTVTESRTIRHRLDVNRRAATAISRALGALELRQGHQQAEPRFRKAVAHVAALSQALTAVEKVLAEANSDLATFEVAANAIVGAQSQHPDIPPPYDESQLSVLRGWRDDFLGDGSNESRLERWRSLCREVGFRV